MDPLIGDITLVHRSPNIVGSLPGGTVPTYIIYEYVDNSILTSAGELYGVEITIVGSGTHTICGTTTWIPPHPTAYPKNYAATRNSGTGTPTIGTVIPSASVQYSNNVPWIEWGIIAGAQGPHGDVFTQFTEVGIATLPIPDWCDYVDAVGLGGGGSGGQGGAYFLPGPPGGDSGKWATTTWQRGVDFTGATILTITIGDGGVFGANGANTTISIPGHTLTAAGGLYAGGPGQYGEGAGNQDYHDVTYIGGVDSWDVGAVPGGGGTSGQDLLLGPGLPGARGGAWVVFRE